MKSHLYELLASHIIIIIIHFNNSWNIELVLSIFNVAAILNIPSLSNSQQDKRVWSYQANGLYSFCRDCI